MPLEIVWSRLAMARLHEICSYIAQHQPDAAERVATRIVAVVEALRNHPHLGHTSSEPGVHELVIGGTPFIIFYRLRATQIVVLEGRHAAQNK